MPLMKVLLQPRSKMMIFFLTVSYRVLSRCCINISVAALRCHAFMIPIYPRFVNNKYLAQYEYFSALFCFLILRGRISLKFSENVGEVAFVRKSDSFSHLRDRHICIAEQSLRFGYSLSREKSYRRHSRGFSEHAAEMLLGESSRCRNIR